MLSSPLARARETAELAGLGDRAELDADLREYDYGDYEGLHHGRDPRAPPGLVPVARRRPRTARRPSQVGERADRAIARALQADGDVALFAHGHVLRALGARWIELPAAYAGHLALGTAAVCELGHERERRVIRLWNDTVPPVERDD